ncbi:hypothetical protein [Plantactinospora sp. KLBMP9567]|uniref:hypothetical protein n=1 Tax=Plantactinospora sp. KLBMP9567 TaxID=3085900 RepID=UPI00298262E4|nr:hypothetical protein [Plantactinospora sp. KLBMP9567]MDW5329720.1 hypothetical protein [Plantactinospora sp. KLBMP9567]
MTDLDAIQITTLAERPGLTARIYEITDTWPVFASEDLLASALHLRVPGEFPEYCVVATGSSRGFAVPFNAVLKDREECRRRAGTWCWCGRSTTGAGGTCRPSPARWRSRSTSTTSAVVCPTAW